MKAMVALLLLAAAGGAHALDCANAVTTAELNACAAQEQQRAEGKLNEYYQGVVARLQDAATRQALIDAQALWVQYREQDCKAVAQQYQGGSLSPVIYTGCMSRHTETRLRHLQNFYQPEQQ